MQLDTIETLVNLNQKGTLQYMNIFLKKNYNKVIYNENYLMAIGNLPIALVAHMDTVFEDSVEQKELFYDKEKEVLWCPQGAGFDDKAGIAAMIEIINRGYRPHIILTTNEECGGLGATIASAKKCPFKGLKYMIQLDRRGQNDCIFYDCDNKEFTEYIETFGFKENWGTFSDISVLCPAWKIAGVNLSIGYENEHTKQEMLRLAWYKATIERVIVMLQSEPPQTFKYIEGDTWKRYYDFYSSLYIKCAKCGKHHFEEELFVVKSKDGKNQLWCPDCISKAQLNWCTSCFQAQETDGEPIITQECEDCKKKKRIGNGLQGNTAAV